MSALYVAVCLLAAGVIVLRGDGPNPRIVSIYPPNGDRYFPGGLAQITFNEEMDQASVERALQVSPGTQGQGSWFGNTLNLQPVDDWRPNVTYHVSLTGRVTDTRGHPLKTPVSFWFSVHQVQHLVYCSVGGVRNVCDRDGKDLHPITRSPLPVAGYALSPDRSILAYIRPDASGLPHLFVIGVDGTGGQQLTRGPKYADSHPSWPAGDNSDIFYRRQVAGKGRKIGGAHLWSITIDGSGNGPV